MINEFYINFNFLNASTGLRESAVIGSDNSFTELTAAIKQLNDCTETYSVVLRISRGSDRFESNHRERRLQSLIAELSKRELEVFELAMKGFGIKETSEKLFISTDTVKTHRKNIVNKADVGKIEDIKNWFLEVVFFGTRR